jgi:hypothetical protein
MTSLINTLPIVQFPTVIRSPIPSPEIAASIDNNETLVDSLSDRYEESCSIHGTGRRQF